MQANQNPQNRQQRITRATSCSFQNMVRGLFVWTDSKVERAVYRVVSLKNVFQFSDLKGAKSDRERYLKVESQSQVV